MLERAVAVEGPLHPGATLAPLVHGRRDPSARLGADGFVRAWQTATGPATLELGWHGLEPRTGGAVTARAWGPGAADALASVEDLLGLRAATPWLDEDWPSPVRDWLRRRPGTRPAKAGPVLDVLVPAILGQRVQGVRAKRSWSGIVGAHGVVAPGPHGLRVPPPGELLAALSLRGVPPLRRRTPAGRHHPPGGGGGPAARGGSGVGPRRGVAAVADGAWRRPVDRGQGHRRGLWRRRRRRGGRPPPAEPCGVRPRR
ncbi:MAG: hypothetical protein R2699_06475 [Acidimicrobiales bacterium]